MSTPSPGQRNLSVSPNSELAPLNTMHRHPGDYQYINNSHLPNHVRGDYHIQGQQPPTTAPFSNSMRPTSHPTGYGPPSILEPPANTDRQPGSAIGSPHMSSVGWQSPSQNSMPSPSHSNGYVYPDPDPYGFGLAQQMYYQNSNLRRPQST